MEGSANGGPPDAGAIKVASLKEDDTMSRILRKGDLARITPNPEQRLKGRENDLCRILKASEIKGDQTSPHPYVYNVQFVHGGKLSRIARNQLCYTTAEAEGFFSDGTSMREKRKRKPPSNLVVEAREPQQPPKPKKLKKTNTTKGAGTKDGKKKASPNPKSKPKPNNKRKASEKSHGKKQQQAAQNNTENDAETYVTKDLYEKHYREFGRALTRLEKMDSFGFFFETQADQGAESQPTAPESTQLPPSALPAHATVNPGSDSSQLMDPAHAVNPGSVSSMLVKPPTNWFELRKRKDDGYYILDRFEKAKKERATRLSPYLTYRRKLRQEGEKVTKESSKKTTKESSKKTTKKRVSVVNQNGVKLHPRVLHKKGVDWPKFRSDVVAMCNAAVEKNPQGPKVGPGTLAHTAKKIIEGVNHAFEKTGKRHAAEMEKDDSRHEFAVLIRSSENKEAAMQVDWRKEPFPEREYERLTSDVICAGLSELDCMSASNELRTALRDSFVGLSYSYNDTGQSEGWMMSVLDESVSRAANGMSDEVKASQALASDDGVVRAQVQATMKTLLIAVQDKVMTEASVLTQPELRSANWERTPNDTDSSATAQSSQLPELVEQSVWGIDCYTRRNISICLERDFDADTAVEFVEKWLLPAINACPVDLAHDMANAAYVLEGMPLVSGNGVDRWSHSLIGKALLQKIRAYGPPWLKAAANQLRRGIESLGHDFFRVHPKGHGSIVLSPVLKANTLVTYYRGEVYPSWRWGEKMDAIEMTQNYLNLRPNLPDFYNMALERPQKDPRGYGMLIVDASRKAGHGSMLSHSCDPTCEVRVAALNGELCLAMTTLRDIEQGEELTFDYNAVTESVSEYQAAVCLCGNAKCRGSFLHFATADCYQQVLNRNSPIAVRFANLVKGCTKKVMSEEDERTLERHGFGTAAFGAVSFDRRAQFRLHAQQKDTARNIPIWLRTFAADVLRYIEYERRALPIALLCNHFDSDDSEENKSDSPKKSSASSSRPSAIYFFTYFSNCNKKRFMASLREQGGGHLKGFELQHALKKIAGSAWQALSDEAKTDWKRRAQEDWDDQHRTEVKSDTSANVENSARSEASVPKEKAGKKTKKKDELNLSKISFEAADMEGVSAMEQRIQQLTQTLSRVGRVLDRHRSSTLMGIANSMAPRNAQGIHAPLSVLSDEEVVSWVWTDKRSIVSSLFRVLRKERCVSPTLLESLRQIQTKHASLVSTASMPGGNSVEAKVVAAKARTDLTAALLDLRRGLVRGIEQLSSDMRAYENEKSRWRSKVRKETKMCEKEGIVQEVAVVLHEMVETVANDEESDGKSDAGYLARHLNDLKTGASKNSPTPEMSTWVRHFDDRWKLEATADILLLYAHTSTFFRLNTYEVLESTPVEVYARELGNQIPRMRIKEPTKKTQDLHTSIDLVSGGSSFDDASCSEESQGSDGARTPKRRKRNSCKKETDFCDPDEPIAKVTVTYTGDYVLSQLLQWYNGGIGQKQGLPETAGCIALPSVISALQCKSKFGGRQKNSTRYHSAVRPKLLEWLRDAHQRGSPFKDDLGEIFRTSAGSGAHPVLGSPILDLLVAGDDTNLNRIFAVLNDDVAFSSATSTSAGSATERLKSTVDQGMPAQAVANWVQCENPKCMKWRKVPWHVDLDLLPEKFFCKDNFWNPAASSCNSPEDAWEEGDSQDINSGVAMKNGGDKHSPEKKEPPNCFFVRVGEKYDVLRRGKDRYCTGVAISAETDGEKRRIKFHFPRVPEKFDEWIDVPSDRVAPLMSKQGKESLMVPKTAEAPQQGQESEEMSKTAESPPIWKQGSELVEVPKTSKAPSMSKQGKHSMKLPNTDMGQPGKQSVKPTKTDEPSTLLGSAAVNLDRLATLALAGLQRLETIGSETCDRKVSASGTSAKSAQKQLSRPEKRDAKLGTATPSAPSSSLVVPRNIGSSSIRPIPPASHVRGGERQPALPMDTKMGGTKQWTTVSSVGSTGPSTSAKEDSVSGSAPADRVVKIPRKRWDLNAGDGSSSQLIPLAPHQNGLRKPNQHLSLFGGSRPSGAKHLNGVVPGRPQPAHSHFQSTKLSPKHGETTPGRIPRKSPDQRAQESRTNLFNGVTRISKSEQGGSMPPSAHASTVQSCEDSFEQERVDHQQHVKRLWKTEHPLLGNRFIPKSK